jgi:hypothetical protein
MTNSNDTERRDTRYRSVRHPTDGTKLFNVGILADGSLHNPNGYSDDLVRAAVLAADERRHQRRSASAKKAGETRRKRQERLVYAVAERLRSGGAPIGPRRRCVICGRGLDDPLSVGRGIGSECWQEVLGEIERLRSLAEGIAS